MLNTCNFPIGNFRHFKYLTNYYRLLSLKWFPRISLFGLDLIKVSDHITAIRVWILSNVSSCEKWDQCFYVVAYDSFSNSWLLGFRIKYFKDRFRGWLLSCYKATKPTLKYFSLEYIYEQLVFKNSLECCECSKALSPSMMRPDRIQPWRVLSKTDN